MVTNRTKRVSIGAGVLIGVTVAVGAVLLITNLLRTDELDLSSSLRRPNAGEVIPDYLGDGSPVWVMGHQDGTVDVLSGFDTHVPFNLGKMLWWCPSAQALTNPHHGSKWDEYGVKLGGPAPTGLPSWEVAVRSSRVFLGDPQAAPALETPPHGPPEHERTWCMAPADPVLFHTFEGWRRWDSPTAAIAAAPDGWILLDGALIVAPERGLVLLCSPTGCADSVAATNVEVPPPGMDPQFGPLGGSRFIGRVRDGVLTDVTRVVFLADVAP
jgi:hypothetical protein